MGRAMAPEPRYLSGNVAAAEGAVAAGCDFYAGYPITPSSEVMEHLAARFHELGRTFVQMEDEIGSICAAIGAAWAGARAMTATSGPGMSLMMEALGYAAFTETPLVIVDVQRAGPCTGQATRTGAGDVMQVKWGSHGDIQPIALSPWSVQEMFSLTARAFDLAERLRVPVVVLAEEAVGHLRERVELPAGAGVARRDRDPTAPPFGTDAPDGVPPMPAFGDGARLLVTGSTHDPRGLRRTEDGAVHEALVTRLHRKVLARTDEICRVHERFVDGAEAVVVAYGFAARAALAAVRRLRAAGRPVGLVRLETLWPFPADAVADAVGDARAAIVPEMNMGQVVGEVRKAVRCRVEGLHRVDGAAIRPDQVARKIREVMGWPGT